MKKIRIFIITFIVFICSISFFAYQKTRPVEISKVLEKKAYSYLPKSAKDYIEKIYEETGEVVLTEKNKKKNTPYLNPEYIKYLDMSKEEQKEVEELPIPYVFDAVVLPEDNATEPGSSYDLRSVGSTGNKKNFLTPIKDQDTLDLCWAYTTTEQAESYLMLKENSSYNANTSKVFSPRQLDYGTSTNGIREYSGITESSSEPREPMAIRSLTTGGNFITSSTILARGLGLVSENTFPSDYNTDEKELHEVLNFENSLYELNSSEVYLNNNYTVGTTEYNNFLKKIKTKVMENGGAYVSTQAPNYTCSSTNHDGKQIIKVDSNCSQDASHAMQIIGWDDSYTYSYCKATCRVKNQQTGETTDVTCHGNNVSNCSSSNLVTGTGAWILRNSWGNTEPYVYLSYDSPTAAIYLSTDLTPMSNRTWDNSYYKKFELSFMAGPQIRQDFEKPIDTIEKLEKVKFHTYGQNGTYTLHVLDGDKKTYSQVKTISVSEMGYATFDVSNLNIYLTDSNFAIYIASQNNVSMINESIVALTSNYDSIPSVDTQHYYSDYSSSGYEIDAYSYTKNIPSNTVIPFELYDDKGNDVSNYLVDVNENIVAKNNMNSIILISGSIPRGIYTLKGYYGTYEYVSKIIIDSTYRLDGDGTQDSPFLIQTESDLRKMSVYMDGHYKLMNDITMTDNWVPVGTETSPFIGSFDGNGHTIMNLSVRDAKYGGLFGYIKSQVSSSNPVTTVKNLTIKNANISGSDAAGAVAGFVTGEMGIGTSWNNPTSQFEISDVSVINGNIYSDYGPSGSAIGTIRPFENVYTGKRNVTLSKFFTSATVGGSTASGGFVGETAGGKDTSHSSVIKLENVENLGIVDLNPIKNKSILPALNTHAAAIGKMSNYNTFNFNYYIISPLFRGFSYSGDGLVGILGSNTTKNSSYGYNTLDSGTSILDLKTLSKYGSWSNFNNNWKMETIDNIPRIPILKNVAMEYTSIPMLEISPGEENTLLTILSSPNFARAYSTSVLNSNIATATSLTDADSGQVYDMKISAHKAGETMIHIISNYDGYENDVLIKTGVAIEEFTIPEDTIYMYVDDTYQINPTINPPNATESKIIDWQVADNSIVTLDSDGIVTAISLGTTTITGTLPNSMSVTLNVIVREFVGITSFSVSNNNIPLSPGNDWTLATIITPLNATESKEITWTSTDSSIATVNSDGKITGVSAGTATITGTLSNNMSVSINVTVTNDTFDYKKGDCNYDGSISMNDAMVALRKMFGYSPIDEKDLAVGDLDGNSLINISDVIRLLRYIFGYLSDL
ncbi:MAG: Ig-like domain-containing protein [Bacilli bacterium]|nr:Ig-like domain-containing protein [Bacilli bacterium]